MIILNWDGSISLPTRRRQGSSNNERPEEFVGHNMIEYLHPDSFQKAAEDLEAVKADKMGFLSEYKLCSVTGRNLWVESIGGKIIFRNASANLVCIRDITERKRAEHALRESEEKYRGILENMDDAYYELDLNGNLVFFNESLVLKTGYSHDELMGMNYRQYVSPETYETVLRIFLEIYKTGQPASLFDYEVIMKGGQKRNYESWASLLSDNNNQPIGFRGMARDITKRKQAEEDGCRKPSKASGRPLAQPSRSWYPLWRQEILIRPVIRSGLQTLPEPLPRRWDYPRIKLTPSGWRVPSMTSGNYPYPRRYCPSPQS